MRDSVGRCSLLTPDGEQAADGQYRWERLGYNINMDDI
jgi:dTDP-4-amino-4,6-dideoxygalactose transaminase